MLLTIVTPYTIVALTKIGKRLATTATLLLALIGATYPLTPQDHCYFNILASVSTPHAYGYPWSLTPKVENISEIELAAKIVEIHKPPVALVSFDLYPAPHIFVKKPVKLSDIERGRHLYSCISNEKT